jgi:hypothetical protein
MVGAVEAGRSKCMLKPIGLARRYVSRGGEANGTRK